MREAAGPTTASKTKLERIARYLKGRQRCVLNFPWLGKLDDVIHVTVGADWAGDPKTRCSTSGGSAGNWPVLHSTSVVSDTGSSHYPQLNQRQTRSRRAVLKLCT